MAARSSYSTYLITCITYQPKAHAPFRMLWLALTHERHHLPWHLTGLAANPGARSDNPRVQSAPATQNTTSLSANASRITANR
jgi:hypothetical protein